MKKSTPFTRSALHTASGKMPVASFNWIWKWWRGACILLFPTPLSTALASQVDMTATGKTLERVRNCKPLASSSIVTGQWCSAFPDTDTNPADIYLFAHRGQPGLSSSLHQSLTVCPSVSRLVTETVPSFYFGSWRIIVKKLLGCLFIICLAIGIWGKGRFNKATIVC